MSFSSLRLARLTSLMLVAVVALLGSCTPSSACDNPRQTEHFVISDARAAALLAAAADGGAGARTCTEECAATPHMATATVVSSCSVDAPTDGGVGLTCVYGFACR